MSDHDDPDPLDEEFRALERSVQAREAIESARQACDREGHELVEVRSLMGGSFEVCARCGYRPAAETQEP